MIVSDDSANAAPAAEATSADGDNEPQPVNPADAKISEYKTAGNSITPVISPNGRRLAVMNGNPSRTMYADGRAVAKDWNATVDIIDTESGKVLTSLDFSRFPKDADRAAEDGPTFVEVTAITFSPHSDVLAVGTSVGYLWLFNVDSGEFIRALDDEDGRLAVEKTSDFWKQQSRVLGHVKSIAFSPDGKQLAVCGDSFKDWTKTLDRVDRLGIEVTAPGRLKVFDLETSELKFNPSAHSDMAVDVEYSPDGKYLASAGRWMEGIREGGVGDGIILWNAKNGERIARVDLDLRGWMYDIAFSPDSQKILAGAQEFDSGGGNGTGVVAMVDAETLAVLWRRPVAGSAMKVAFNPQQASVIVLSDRKGVRFIDEEAGSTSAMLTAVDVDAEKKQVCTGFDMSQQGHLLVFGITQNRQGRLHSFRIGQLDDEEVDSTDDGDSRAAEDAPAVQGDQVSHNVYRYADNDEQLREFAALPGCREMNVQLTDQVTLDGLSHLANMQHLEKLTVTPANSQSQVNGDDVIRHIVGLKSLRELNIIECGTSDAGAKLLELMPRLTSLSLRQEGRLTDRALASIGTLTNLESLSLDAYVGDVVLGWMRFSADGVRQLKGLHRLKHLSLVGQDVPADAIDFPLLVSLGLGHDNVDDSVAAQVAQLQKLRSLNLMFTSISNDGLRQIAQLPHLRRLDLNSRVITDEGIGHLTACRKLEHVSLRAINVTEQSLSSISSIPTLNRVDLSWLVSGPQNGKVAWVESGLSQLVKLPNLKSVWLTNCRFPGGYSELQKLKGLNEITMTMCDVTTSELQALEQALPNTRISHMTGGGHWGFGESENSLRSSWDLPIQLVSDR